ncbi:MAG: CocE/NonD family hydrolase [Gemmatimonadetes bacterium]|nr:CocE/NonD family hydrolase [Gemmatimonadota bacterium]MDA1104507.1 CocE/NonD family hydrolase [Gemmatimonadota bacterium]
MNFDGWFGPSVTRRDFARIVSLAAASTLPGCRSSAADFSEDGMPVDGPYDVALLDGIMVPMRDGVRLATDVHVPARDGSTLDGPWPVILERTPYGKQRPSRSERSVAEPARAKTRDEVARIFVERGYVVVYQDVRGRYDSEGIYQKYLDDAPDGYDTCAWILEQPWCNGKIGTKGLSYAAHTQGALASAGAPGVAAMFLDSGGFSNSYQGGIRQGGAFELKQATWAYSNGILSPEVTGDTELSAAMQAVDIRQWFHEMPWRPGHSPVSLAPDYEAYLFEQWTKGEFDEYWKQAGIYAEGFYDVWPDAPMVHMSSWFDPYPRTATDNYLGLSDAKRGPVRLILGPWTHGDRSLTWAGDVDFGPDATLDGQLAKDYWELRVRWFDHWLRGVDNGVDREPTVRYFLMGGGSGLRNAAGRMDHGGSWRTAEDWPIHGTVETPHFLSADGRLTLAEPTGDDVGRTYQFDPGHPVPSIGGTITSGAPVMVGGAFDQREGPDFFGSREPYRSLSERPDVLVFQTAPLTSDIEVTGPLRVKLWITSDCPDTDFTAKLIDVYPANADYPDGFAMNLTDGIIRCRYRDSWESPTLMEPGRTYEVTIDAFPTSNLFKAGHKIRLDISSSNYPHFDLNFNTGEAEGLATRSRVATNTIWMDRSRPSHAVLPIVPGGGR